jgi:AraC-like DNA-binding protein
MLTAYHSCLEGTWEIADAIPDRRLHPGVTRYRGFRLDLGRQRRRLEIPTGTVTLLLNVTGSLRITKLADGQTREVTDTSMVAGPSCGAAVGEHDGRLAGMEVVLTPLAAVPLLGIPLREVSDHLVELSDLVGRRADALVGRLAAARTWPARFALLDSALAEWSTDGAACSPQVVRAWQRLVSTAGTVPIALLAREVGWCRRRLESCFRQQIGHPPKVAARILRLRRALTMLAAGRPAAQVAVAAGYHDQSHLSHECKAMTGYTVGRFVAERAGIQSRPPVVDRIDGQVTSLLLPDRFPA